MKLSLSKLELKEYVKNQLQYFFPDKYVFGGKDVDQALDLALDRLNFCFSHMILKDYFNGKESIFYHLHSDQYSQFLYFFANSLFKISENKVICDKLVLLNRALHGFFVTYRCELPNIFIFIHPVGSIIGNARYEDYLCVLQNVTINSSPDLKIGRNVTLGVGTQILGVGNIGDRVSFGGNVSIYHPDIKSDSIVYCDEKGAFTIKRRKKICSFQKGCFKLIE